MTIHLSKEIKYPKIFGPIGHRTFRYRNNHIHTCYCDNKKTSASVSCIICRWAVHSGVPYRVSILGWMGAIHIEMKIHIISCSWTQQNSRWWMESLIRSRRYIWAVQNRCFVICNITTILTNYTNPYFQELYHVFQLRGDDIMKRSTYRVEKIIVSYILFHDQDFFHIIQIC